MAYKIARPGSEGNMRLLKEYGGGSKGPRQSYATGGAVKGGNPSLNEGLAAAGGPGKPSGKPSKGDGKKGDKKDAKTAINIVVMGKPDGAAPMPPPGASGLAPPPGPMPPSPGPGGPPMPPMRAHGGRVKREDIAVSDKAAKQDVMHTSPGKLAKGGVAKYCKGGMAKRAVGGPVKAPTEKSMLAEKGYQGGGGGAIGRLEKRKAYGK